MAVIVPTVVVCTLEAHARTVTLVRPAGTVTVAGSVTRPETLQFSTTVTSDPAAELRATVTANAEPEATSAPVTTTAAGISIGRGPGLSALVCAARATRRPQAMM